jgi:anaerobic magnesium-protoporphyrin IX monomethyl ester cyclase
VNSLDLLLVSVPPSHISEPPIAPALLKASVEANGFTCRTVDFSLICFNKTFNKDYTAFNNWCNILPEHFDWSNVSEDQSKLTNQVIDEFISLLSEKNPKFVGISVFSFWQQRFVYFLCKKIKKLNLDVKIILGGMGCDKHPSGLSTVLELTSFDKMSNFASLMIKLSLADFVILNDGEIELVNILKNNTLSNVDKEVSFEYKIIPNFDDYKLDEYLFAGNRKMLAIQGSKGCVRKCVFCTHHRDYSKFYFKSGVDIAEEIIYLSKKYDVYNFQFIDSLVNGSLREFKNFVGQLAEYNQANEDKKISWHGSYICRASSELSDEDFKIIKLSGAHGLTIGAESGSNQVLKEMKKQTTAEDLEYEISKFEEFNINCSLLFIVGFYNETWEDFMMTLNLLKRLQKYFYNGTISSVRLGYTLAISDWDQLDVSKFEYDKFNVFDWTYLPNPTLTLKERIRRRIIAQEFCDRLGIPVSYAREDLLVLDAIYNNNHLHANGNIEYVHN